jgi:hypothetical protein
MIAGLAPGLAPAHQFARRLAENGCAVLVPVLIDRAGTWSGNAQIQRFTNQPHREWIYRQGFELGRHIIGYEVEKVIAGLDWFARSAPATNQPLGVLGYAEGGLIAFYAAALDSRIQAVLVSGYFDSRQQLAEEPIYRNLFGLLTDFGDAEIATLITPRALVVEYSALPRSMALRKPGGTKRRAPGRLRTRIICRREEFERARVLLNGDQRVRSSLDQQDPGMATIGPGSRVNCPLNGSVAVSRNSNRPPKPLLTFDLQRPSRQRRAG